jgi:hypothetical protein
MKIDYEITATLTGELDRVINCKPTPFPTLAEVLANMKELAFIVETVAHLQGQEQLLPAANKARAIIAQLNGN